jgi:hypothetical protein
LILTGSASLVVTRLRDSALFAVVAAIAAYVVAPNTTPIDRALPFVVIVLAVCLFTTEETEGTKASVPFVPSVVILLPPIFFTDEHTRLLAYGVIAAIAFALAGNNVVTTICGVLLIRWIPFSDVVIWRELVVLAGAITVFLASRSAAVAIAVALFTPIFPRWAMAFPFLAGLLFVFLPKIRVPVWIAAALLVMWPWSGIVARAMPAFLRAEPPPKSQPVWIALAPGESVSIDAPPGAHRAEIIASGANAAKLRRATLMGMIDGKQIRIGDIADFGYTRREQFFFSRNPSPKRPINDVKGYGQSAWLHTAGVIEVPVRNGAIHVAAAPDLPPNTRLQIEAVAFE